jgi:hypothetical protein
MVGKLGKTMAEQFINAYPNEEKEKSKEKKEIKIIKEKHKSENRINKLLKQKITYKPMKQKQLIVEIKESKPVKYVSTYFKNEWEEAKKSLFFS